MERTPKSVIEFFDTLGLDGDQHGRRYSVNGTSELSKHPVVAFRPTDRCRSFTAVSSDDESDQSAKIVFATRRGVLGFPDDVHKFFLRSRQSEVTAITDRLVPV